MIRNKPAVPVLGAPGVERRGEIEPPDGGSIAPAGGGRPATDRGPGLGDGFANVGQPTAIAHDGLTRHDGLPALLLSTDRVQVKHGTDPGDYYCEHLFFVGQREALRSDSSIVKNAAGEPLVGFLHVPKDNFGGRVGEYTQAERHAGTREVVGVALRGFVDEVGGKQVDGPVKILVTGYGAFNGTVNNPTGEFAAQVENIDAAMQHGFGDRLLTPQGERVQAVEPDGQLLRYRIRQGEGEREVLVRCQQLPVDDRAIDGESPESAQRIFAEFKPHAALAMGVAGGSHYRAEFHADSGGLELEGSPRHEGGAVAELSLADNYALARAILAGQRANEGGSGGVLGLLARRD